MRITKLLITVIILITFIFASSVIPAYAESTADASDFEFIVGKNGQLEFKNIACAETSGTREKAHTFGTFSTWNYTAEPLEDGTRRATPTVDDIYGYTLKCGPYTSEPWSITKNYSTDRVRISAAIKKYDKYQQLCIYPRGVAGVVFSTDGKIYLADTDTGLKYDLNKWYEVELYADRITKRDVLYLTDVSAGVTYRREAMESAAFEPNHVASLARKVGGVETAPLSYFEFAYFRVASVSAENFPSTHSFEATFNDAHVKASGFNSVERSKHDGWTFQTPKHTAQTGYITIPSTMPTSGTITLSFDSYGNYKRIMSPVTYDATTETWSKLAGVEDLLVMNAVASLNQTSSDVLVSSWNGTDMELTTQGASWNGENGSRVTFVIDLDNPRTDIKDFPAGATANTKYYDVDITVKDLLTNEETTSVHTIPFDFSVIDGFEFSFPGTEKQVNEGYDYASITNVSFISSLDTDRMVIASKPFYSQKNVELDASVEIYFDLAPLDGYIYNMTDKDDLSVPFTKTVEGNKVTLTPKRDLEAGKTYLVKVLNGNTTLFTTNFTTMNANEVCVLTTQPSSNKTNYSITAMVKPLKSDITVKIISAAYDNDTKKLLSNATVTDSVAGSKMILATVDPGVSNTTLNNFVIDSFAGLKLLNTDKALTGVTPVITKAEFDLDSIVEDSGKFTFAGKFEGITAGKTVPAGTKLFVALVKDSIDLTTVSNDDFLANAPYFGEVVTTDSNGTFGLTLPVDATDGNYRLYVSYNGDTAPYTYAKKVPYYSAGTLTDIKDAINGATTAEELLDRSDDTLTLSGLLYDNKDALGIDLRFATDKAFVIEDVGKYIIDKRPSAGYANMTDLQTRIREIITLCSLAVADDADRINLIQNNSSILQLTDIEEFAIYNGLVRTGAKEYVVSKIGNHTEIADYIKDFKDQTILGAIKYVNSYKEVSELFEKFSDILVDAGVNISDYNSLKDTSVIDKQVVGYSFKTVEDLAGFVNPLIAEANKSAPAKKQGSSSGGSKSSGGGFMPISKDPASTIPAADTKETSDSFSDLSGYDWAKEAITNLEKLGIVSGKGNGIYDPGGDVLREEFTKMIVKLFELKGNGETQFDDVKEQDWSYEFIDAAVASGIVNGIGNGKFGNGNRILRQDMAVMLFRAAVKAGILENKEVNAEQFADDKDIDEYAKSSIYALLDAGVVNGTGNGQFSPKETATRAEAAKIIYEILKIKDSKQ